MRQQVTYQTVTLTKGRHASPEQGACVMELASMLAGEPFTDHPESVSASIASFLRIYNDILDDERRQDLSAYAAKAVGTAAAEPVEQARIARLLDWGDQRFEISGLWILNRLRRMRIRNRLRRRCIDRWALMDVEIAPSCH